MKSYQEKLDILIDAIGTSSFDKSNLDMFVRLANDLGLTAKQIDEATAQVLMETSKYNTIH